MRNWLLSLEWHPKRTGSLRRSGSKLTTSSSVERACVTLRVFTCRERTLLRWTLQVWTRVLVPGRGASGLVRGCRGSPKARHHELRLGHDRRFFVVGSRDRGLPDHRGPPPVERDADRTGRLSERDRPEEVRLALDRGRSCAVRQIEHAGCPAQDVGKGHDGSAMHDAVAVGKFLANSQLCYDPIA